MHVSWMAPFNHKLTHNFAHYCMHGPWPLILCFRFLINTLTTSWMQGHWLPAEVQSCLGRPIMGTHQKSQLGAQWSINWFQCDLSIL